MDAKSADTRPRLSHRVGALVDSFETVIYAIGFLLLVAAAILGVIGGAEAVGQAAGAHGRLPAGRCACPRSGADGSDRCRDRRHAARGSAVSRNRRRAVSLHRLDRLRATDPDRDGADRTGAFGQAAQSLAARVGRVGLLVIGIAAAIFMIRVSTKRVAHADSDDG